MSSNSSSYYDEFGLTPDWIEIYNGSSESIDLGTVFLSDDYSFPNKWQFPPISISPSNYLLVHASGRDIKTGIGAWETVIKRGDIWNYKLGFQEPPSLWKELGFQTIGWNSGFSGIGYGDEDDATIIQNESSVYLRKTFTIANKDNVTGLMFNIDFDDGYVAYINGIEISRENLGSVGETISYNRFADNPSEARLYRGQPLDAIFIENFNSILVNGENVLAIQVHNANATSSDLTAIPFLSVGYKFSGSYEVAEEIADLIPQLHTNFSISNGNESIYLFNFNREIIDSLPARLLPSDISIGRTPDGNSEWKMFSEITPGFPNSNNGFEGQLENPTLNYSSGFYNSEIPIEVTNLNLNENVHYTINGSEPNQTSRLVGDPITISNTTVLKFKSFKDGYIPSNTITNTYFINEQTNLPVISISTNPLNLWDYQTGIYVLGPNASPDIPRYGANFWEDWTKPATFEYLDQNKQKRISEDVDIKIFGGWSRANPQKSLSVFAKSGKSLNYKFFENLNIENFKSVVLRNSGNDWFTTMLRDGFMQTLANDLNIDNLAYQPAIMFLNGEYWGIHNIREKINLNYIASHYDVSKEDIDLLELDGNIIDGTNESYNQLKNYISNSNLSSDVNFSTVERQIDISSFIDYYLFEIYIGNTDWPGNNAKFWRDRVNNGKWRWILFDTDFGFQWRSEKEFNFSHNTLSFALEANGSGWPNPPWSTLFLRKFIENEKFKNEFINRFADLCNTLLQSSNVKQILSTASNNISAEMVRHLEKWGNTTISNWNNNIDIMENFADLRLPYLKSYFNSEFNLSGTASIDLSMNSESAGKIQINSITPLKYPWAGDYFKGTQIKVIAIPNPGYEFSEWTGTFNSLEDTLNVNFTNSLNLKANFKRIINYPQIVINEINYNSYQSFDTEDWVELFNNSEHQVDISNWVFKDEVDSQQFIIPTGTILQSKGYLVVCRDTNSFKLLRKDDIKIVGDFNFGLSNSGDLIRIFSGDGVLIDSIRYSDDEPWPKESDGFGKTLELKNPDLDNSIYFNWAASSDFGTPGLQNSSFIVNINEEQDELPEDFYLLQNYPNPFNPSTKIEFGIPLASRVELGIYNIVGEKITTVVDEYLESGKHEFVFNNKKLSSGVYFYRLKTGNNILVNKMILMK